MGERDSRERQLQGAREKGTLGSIGWKEGECF